MRTLTQMFPSGHSEETHIEILLIDRHDALIFERRRLIEQLDRRNGASVDGIREFGDELGDDGFRSSDVLRILVPVHDIGLTRVVKAVRPIDFRAFRPRSALRRTRFDFPERRADRA